MIGEHLLEASTQARRGARVRLGEEAGQRLGVGPGRAPRRGCGRGAQLAPHPGAPPLGKVGVDILLLVKVMPISACPRSCRVARDAESRGGSPVGQEDRPEGVGHEAMMRRATTSVEVRPTVFDSYNRWIQTRMAGTAYVVTNNYYKAPRGKIVTQWPYGPLLYASSPTCSVACP
jgi:hypothetical protein